MSMFLESVYGETVFRTADEHVQHQMQSLEDGRWQVGSDRHS